MPDKRFFVNTSVLLKDLSRYDGLIIQFDVIRQEKNLIHSLTATAERVGAKRQHNLCDPSDGKAMPAPSVCPPQGINKHSGTPRSYNEFSLLYNHGYKRMTHRRDVKPYKRNT